LGAVLHREGGHDLIRQPFAISGCAIGLDSSNSNLEYKNNLAMLKQTDTKTPKASSPFPLFVSNSVYHQLTEEASLNGQEQFSKTTSRQQTSVRARNLPPDCKLFAARLWTDLFLQGRFDFQL
jgi:hypothetical protein